MADNINPSKSNLLLMVMTLFLFILLPTILFLVLNKNSPCKKRSTSTSKQLLVPPGPLGLPVVGQSLTLLRAMRSNTADKWVSDRIRKYGDVSKLSLFGKPTVLIHGQAANKFVFAGGNSDLLGNSQTESVKTLMGERNILELSGEDHKRVRGALMSFLKPECLKDYVGKMDQELQTHLQTHWSGAQQVKVVPLMKNLTFNIISSLLIGLEHGSRREELINYFRDLVAGMWSLPIDLPFTRYRSSLKSSARITDIIKDLIREKKEKLEKGVISPNQDIITSLISCKTNESLVSDEEIIHNIKLIMIAGHDTSAVVISFMIRLLGRDPVVYETVLQEQEQVLRSKASRLLTWEDLGKMKYTWKVALETMRLIPPIFGGFRKALQDIEFDGFLIPKGWQVLWVSSMTHLDNNIFPEPSKFDPTRFDNQAGTGTVPPYCYIPFGAGPRICPGYEFAKIEILVTIHSIVTQFKWKLCCDDDFFGRDPMPMPTQGLPIQIVSREENH